MGRKKLFKSPLAYEMTLGGISLNEQYQQLEFIWKNEPDLRKTLIKCKVANKRGLLKREEIEFNDALNALHAIEEPDYASLAHSIQRIKLGIINEKD